MNTCFEKLYTFFLLTFLLWNQKLHLDTEFEEFVWMLKFLSEKTSIDKNYPDFNMLPNCEFKKTVTVEDISAPKIAIKLKILINVSIWEVVRLNSVSINKDAPGKTALKNKSAV